MTYGLSPTAIGASRAPVPRQPTEDVSLSLTVSWVCGSMVYETLVVGLFEAVAKGAISVLAPLGNRGLPYRCLGSARAATQMCARSSPPARRHHRQRDRHGCGGRGAHRRRAARPGGGDLDRDLPGVCDADSPASPGGAAIGRAACRPATARSVRRERQREPSRHRDRRDRRPAAGPRRVALDRGHAVSQNSMANAARCSARKKNRDGPACVKRPPCATSQI